MGVLRLGKPSSYPITADEVKARLHMEDCADVNDLKRMIAAATSAIEKKTQRALVSQKWEFSFDRFPGANSFSSFCDGVFFKKNSSVISLPFPPLISVESIKYVDTNGVQQTLSDSDYEVDISTFLGSVYPVYGKAWPATRIQPNAVRIQFTAGYGEPEDVEPDLVLAITLLVGQYDLYREAIADRQMFEIPNGIESILSPYIVPSAP